MNKVIKSRFLTWCMFALVFFCTGPIGIGVWTIYQLYEFSNDKKEYNNKKTPVRKRKEIIEINKEDNLTKEEKNVLKKDPNMIKIGNYSNGTIYLYCPKK